MKRRIIPVLALMACLCGCTEMAVPMEDGAVSVSFSADGPSPWAAGTRSVLTGSDIETKATGVTLAAYTTYKITSRSGNFKSDCTICSNCIFTRECAIDICTSDSNCHDLVHTNYFKFVFARDSST